MTKSIDIDVSTAVSQPLGGPGAYRIVITAVNAVGISDHVFVCEQSEIVGQEDAFLCVATADDMVSLPESPDGTGIQLRYRTNTIDLYFGTEDQSDAEEFVESIRRRVQSLLFSSEALDTMSAPRRYSLSA